MPKLPTLTVPALRMLPPLVMPMLLVPTVTVPLLVTAVSLPPMMPVPPTPTVIVPELMTVLRVADLDAGAVVAGGDGAAVQDRGNCCPAR